MYFDVVVVVDEAYCIVARNNVAAVRKYVSFYVVFVYEDRFLLVQVLVYNYKSCLILLGRSAVGILFAGSLVAIEERNISAPHRYIVVLVHSVLVPTMELV